MDIENLLREMPAGPFFPPCADRAAWERVGQRLGAKRAAYIQAAETAAREPIPALPATLWLECKRSGERKNYENACYQRRLILGDLALGECLEGQGRFLDALTDVIWAICEESSWVYPAHHVELADVDQPYIDLGAAYNGFLLGEIDGLLGSVLPAAVGRRIRSEVNRRLFIPYLARHDFWWLANQRDSQVNNWTAVCNGGVMAAALYLEPDPARLADILVKGLRSLDDYLSTFDADGGTSEGPGYWSYGFGAYTLIAQLAEQRSQGQLTLMDGDLLKQIAAFPLRTMLSPGHYVNFSDALRQASFIPAMLTYLGSRLELPGLLDLARNPDYHRAEGLNRDFFWQLRALFWDLPAPGGAQGLPARHDWYPEMMWMIARDNPEDPDGLALAAKGGHNAEMHNHNDVGAFILQFRQEALIADTGVGRYTLQYFGPQRYEHFAASSLGHSVPAPNGVLQANGRQHAARLLEHSTDEQADRLGLDLTAAYPQEAGLQALERRLVLHRHTHGGDPSATAWVELEDSCRFQESPAIFETALVTFAEVLLGDGAVLIKGLNGELRVGYDSQAVETRLELYQDVDLDDGERDVRRIVFSSASPALSASIRLEIVPIFPTALQ